MRDKPLAWLHGEVRTPPFSRKARIEAGFSLRLLQKGQMLSLPKSRPMPAIGARCHELRLRDDTHNWRIFYRVEADAILILGVHDKKAQKTPRSVIEVCRERARRYDADAGRSRQ